MKQIFKMKSRQNVRTRQRMTDQIRRKGYSVLQDMDLNITFKGQSTCFEIVFSLSLFAAFLSRRAVTIKAKLRRSHRHITGCLRTDEALWNCGEKSPAAASGVPYWCRFCGCLDESRWSFCARVRCHTSVWCKAGSLSPRAGIYLEQRPEQKTTSHFVSAFSSECSTMCVCVCVVSWHTHTRTHTRGGVSGSSGCCRGPTACWVSLFLSRWAISLVTLPAHEELRVSQAH